MVNRPVAVVRATRIVATRIIRDRRKSVHPELNRTMIRHAVADKGMLKESPTMRNGILMPICA